MDNLLKDFINHERILNRADNTIEIYEYEVKRFLNVYEIDSVSKLNILEDKDFLMSFIEDYSSQYSSSYTNKVKSSVSVFMNYLALEGIINENILRLIPNVKNTFKKVNTYTSDEIEKIKNLINYKIDHKVFRRKVDKDSYKMQRLAINILISTGLRINELVNIRMSDINGKIFGVRGKGYRGEVSRTNAFSSEVVEYLNEYLEIRESLDIKEGCEDYLLISPLNKTNVTEDGIRKFLKNILKELGIEGKSAHDLRHKKATTLLENGVSLEKTSKLLGHANVVITSKIYSHLTDNDMEELVNM